MNMTVAEGFGFGFGFGALSHSYQSYAITLSYLSPPFPIQGVRVPSLGSTGADKAA